MSLQNTPAAERIHIGFFGRRNAGKSSLVNAMRLPPPFPFHLIIRPRGFE